MIKHIITNRIVLPLILALLLVPSGARLSAFELPELSLPTFSPSTFFEPIELKATSYTNTAALSLGEMANSFFDFLVYGFNELKDEFSFSIPSAPSAPPSPPTPPTPPTPILTPSPEPQTPSINLDSLRSSLLSELEAYIDERLTNTPSIPLTTLNPVPLDIRELIARQSDSDTNRISNTITTITNSGSFTGSTLSGATISNSTGDFTSISSTNATGVNSTTTNATTTNFYSTSLMASSATTTSLFATTASSTNLFSTTGNIGTLTLGSGTLSNLLLTGSTTLQNFTFLNATGTSATTTNFFSITASSTNLFSSLLSVGGSALNVIANGNVGIGTTGPAGKLHVVGTGSGASLANTGTVDATINARIGRSLATMDFGILDDGAGYIQSRNQSNLATNYNLLLSPNGGNVGIGTTNPDEKFHVEGTGTINLKARTTTVDGIAGLALLNDARQWQLSVRGDDSDKFYIRDATAGVARMVINSSGNVSIGTTSVLGSAGAVSRVSILSDQNSTWGMAIQPVTDVATGFYIAFQNAAGTNQGSISATNSTTVAYNTSSDERLKLDLGVATSTSILENTIIHNFKWHVDGTDSLGVFAQEAYLVNPRAVTIGSDERDSSGNLERPWSVDYSKYVPDLIVGWQVLNKKINDFYSEFLAIKDAALALADKMVSREIVAMGVLRVDGEVCVDDVCISKEQFKAMLVNAGGGSSQSTTNDPQQTTDSTSTTTNTTSTSTQATTSNQEPSSGAEQVEEVVVEEEVATSTEEVVEEPVE